MILSFAAILMSCGGGTSSSKEEEAIQDSTETSELSPTKEDSIANEISTQVHAEAEEIKKTTEENLQEVDSLLETL